METYQEQLESFEWRTKREVILERDSFQCTKCGVKRTPFVGISQEFGFKDFFEMKESGHTPTLMGNTIVMLKNSFLTVINQIEGKADSPDLKKLYYAKRWKEPNTPQKSGYFEIICISEKPETPYIFPDLNIHHKYYIKGKKAWEYEDEALITLCVKCHQEEHETNTIPVLDEQGNLLYEPQICDRCGGSGYLAEYNYYQNGVCFKCGGNGVII